MRDILYNPFRYIAGTKALLLGLVVIIITSLLTYNFSIIFENTLRIRFVPDTAPLWVFFLNNFLNWLSIAFFLYLFGILISKSRIRFIDVLGTQALARFPLILYSLIGFFPAGGKYNRLTLRSFMEGETVNFAGFDVWIFLILSLLGTFVIIWYIFLMYNAYSISCNLKKEKGVISFISAIVIGGFFSRVIYLTIVAKIIG